MSNTESIERLTNEPELTCQSERAAISAQLELGLTKDLTPSKDEYVFEPRVRPLGDDGILLYVVRWCGN